MMNIDKLKKVNLNIWLSHW